MTENVTAPPGESAFARLSTGIKMLLIIVAALLPLGLIALFASLESAHSNRIARETAATALATNKARALDAAIARTALTLRAATTALAGNPDSENCLRTLQSLAASHSISVNFAIFDSNGKLLCATDSFRPRLPVLPGDRTRIELAADGAALQVIVGAVAETAVGVGELSRATIAGVAQPQALDGSFQLTLLQEERAMPLVGRGSALARRGLTTDVPLAGGQLVLRMMTRSAPVTATEVLLTVLPILMLIAAASIGWLVIDRLVLRPLAQLHDAVSNYRAGDRRLALPVLTTPAYEIRTLGDAFRGVTETISRHEADLEEGLARQVKLTREVHHRVKNNLQVVASLLNLHARSAVSSDAADAYAAIQRRVDALAVVHRNHFAELEENRGVALRPLIGEIAANLRASAPAGAAAMPIGVNIAPCYVTQDVAVPVAFLITEVVEAAMLAPRPSALTISLTPAETENRAVLSLSSEGLKGSPPEGGGDRIGRVIEGLARQLRSKLTRDEELGRVSVELPLLASDRAS